MSLLDGEIILPNTEEPGAEMSPEARRRVNEARVRAVNPPQRGDGRLPRHFLYECFENTRESQRRAGPDERCAWPGCSKERAATEHYGGEVPLCIGHVYETWRIARDMAEGTRNRQPTIDVIDPDGMGVKRLERPVAQMGWIYYLRIGDSIKVGYASNLENRLKSYPPSAEFLYAHPGNKNTEKSAHGMLHLWRNAGREWYDDRTEVLAYVDKVKLRYNRTGEGVRQDPRPKKAPPKQQVVAMRSRSGASYRR